MIYNYLNLYQKYYTLKTIRLLKKENRNIKIKLNIFNSFTI